MRRHNRFVLVAAFVLDSIVFGELITIALEMNSYVTPIFTPALQADCLLNTPQVYSTQDCTTYFNSDRTAGFRLLWEYYFVNRQDVNNNQGLIIINYNKL